ncbi:MAG: CC_3452 family protein [Caulobacteraceae bacterium]
MSAFRSIVAAAIISAAFATPALARDVYTIRLAAPVAEQTRVIALNTIWDCNGDTCLARADHGANVRSCRQFVRESNGLRIASYGSADDQLTADEVARCNGETQAQQAANN